MDRRKFVATAGTAITVGVAGCTGGGGNGAPFSASISEPAVMERDYVNDLVYVELTLEGNPDEWPEFKALGTTYRGYLPKISEGTDGNIEDATILAKDGGDWETKETWIFAKSEFENDQEETERVVLGAPGDLEAGTTFVLYLNDPEAGESMELGSVTYESVDTATAEGTETATEESETTEETETTVEQSLAVETHETTATEDFTATLAGEVTELEGYDAASCYFEWRQSDEDWQTTESQAVEATGEFTAELTDLATGTEYEFRAVAEAEDETVAGETRSFETRALDISFSDDWEDGTYTESPVWVTDHNTAGGMDEVSAKVKEAQSPDGGSNSLSIYAEDGSSARVFTHDTFRFDAPWVVEGTFRVHLEEHWGRYELSHRIKIAAKMDDNFADDVVLYCYNGDGNRRGTVSFDGGEAVEGGGSIDVLFEDGVWFRYKCLHDGDGLYRLKFWRDGEGEPDSPQLSVSGSIPETGEQNQKQLGFDVYGSGPQTVEHAFISYETK